MVYCLQELFAIHKVRPIPVYVDSPLALRLTDIHREYPGAYTPEAQRLMDKDPKYFGSKYVEFCETWDDSRRLNYQPGPMVIIASSGMCEAGPDPGTTSSMRWPSPTTRSSSSATRPRRPWAGRSPRGSSGSRSWTSGFELNAAVYVLDGFSGHADRNDLAWWFGQTGGKVGKAFLVHGEPASLEALKPLLQPHVETDVIIPERLESYEV